MWKSWSCKWYNRSPKLGRLKILFLAKPLTCLMVHVGTPTTWKAYVKSADISHDFPWNSHVWIKATTRIGNLLLNIGYDFPAPYHGLGKSCFHAGDCFIYKRMGQISWRQVTNFPLKDASSRNFSIQYPIPFPLSIKVSRLFAWVKICKNPSNRTFHPQITIFQPQILRLHPFLAVLVQVLRPGVSTITPRKPRRWRIGRLPNGTDLRGLPSR